MSYSPRHQSSRRAKADASDSGHATYDDHEDYPRPFPPRHVDEAHSALSSHGGYRSQALHDRHRGYHPCVSADRREARDITVTSHKISVTRYRIGESATSYHDRREYTAYDNHRSSSGYWEADPRSNRDDRYLENRQRRHHQEVTKPSRPKEPKLIYKEGRSSKSKGYSNRKYAGNDNPRQGEPESSSSRRQEKPNSGRSESRRGENPRSNRKDRSHEDRKHGYYQEVPLSKAKEKMPDHYAILKLGLHATAEEIRSAARCRRIEVHPDKLKKEGMSESERAKIDAAAAKVGQAADVLQNPEQKRKYDRELYAANGMESECF